MTLVGSAAAALAGLCACLAAFGVTAPLPRARPSRRDLAIGAATGAAGVAVGLALGVPFLGPLAGVLPWWWRRRGRERDRANAQASILPVLETLVATSRAGLVLPEALAAAVLSARGELAAALEAALLSLRLGAAPADALRAARATTSAPGVVTLLSDLELCARSRLGAEDTAGFLDDVLERLRFERELASDLRARTSGQRFQVWLLAAVVPALALYLSVMSPTLAGQLASPLGQHVLIPAGALFEIGGIVVSRRVLKRASRPHDGSP